MIVADNLTVHACGDFFCNLVLCNVSVLFVTATMKIFPSLNFELKISERYDENVSNINADNFFFLFMVLRKIFLLIVCNITI